MRRVGVLLIIWVLAGTLGTPLQAPADPLFGDSQEYDAGGGPHDAAVGYLNADALLDVVTANFNNTVGVLLGNGDGTLQAPVTYPAGSNPTSVAIGDLNQDYIPDLVTANLYSDDVSVLLGNGDGTFQAQVRYATGDAPYCAAIGLLDSDNIPDLAVARGNGYVAVLLGNGDGTYQSYVGYATAISSSSVVIEDLDGDLIMDLAVASDGGASVLLGNGDGTFQPRVNYAAGSIPNDIAVAELDGMGGLDLVVANGGSDNVSVLLGNGDGTFQTRVNYGAGDFPQGVTIRDVDRDGAADLVVANQNTNDVWVLLGNGDGTFQAGVSYLVGDGPLSVATGDLDGDGDPDIAAGNFYGATVSVLLNLSPLRHILYPTDDAFISMEEPNENWGSASSLSVRNRYGGEGTDYWERNTLAKFDLSSIPPGSTITSATLHLHYFDCVFSNCNGRDLNCRRITNSWDEDTVTWNTRPGTAPAVTDQATVPSTFDWMDWDVTADVQAIVDGEEDNEGWQISDEVTWGDFDIPDERFRSKEYGDYVPYLEIVYECGHGVPSLTPMGVALLGGLVFAIGLGGLAVQGRRRAG